MVPYDPPTTYMTYLKVLAVLFELMIFTMIFFSLRRKKNMNTQKLVILYVRYLFIIHLCILAILLIYPVITGRY